VLDRFFTVLPITPSFLVRFRPVKYRIEALNVLHALVRGWSVRFSFWSGQRSGQTSVKLGQPRSNLVKLGRYSPNSGNVSRAAFRGFSGIVDPSRVRNGLVNPWSNLVKPSQTWSNLVKFGQNVSRTFFLGVFDVASPRRIRPARFGLSRFACRHPRKSRG
jgi:hypothetical protein